MYSKFKKIAVIAVLIGSTLVIRDQLIKFKRRREKMPTGPTGLPIFGNLLDVTDPRNNNEKLNRFLIKWGKKSDLFTIRIGNKDMIVINDIKLYKDLHSNNKFFLLNEYRPDVKHSILGFSVFAFENEDKLWSKRRKFIMQTLIRQFDSKFTNQTFEKHFSKLTVQFENEFNKFNKLTGKFAIDWSTPFVDISKINFLAMYELMFNGEDDMDANMFLDFQHGIYSVLRNFSIWFLVDQLPIYISSFFYSHKATTQLLNKYVYPTLYESYNKAIKAHKSGGNYKSLTLIDYMINSSIYKGNKERIFGDCSVMLTLGMAGTSIRLTSALYCLAVYPEICDELFDELKQIYPDYICAKKDFSFKKCNQCHKLRAFIFEVIRLSSDIKLGIMRVNNSKQGIPIKSYVIPPKCNVLINTYFIEQCNNNYSFPNSIYLNHFLDSKSKKFKKHDSFFAFGTGQRNCVGKSVAIKEMLYVLTNIILNKYKFILPTNDPNYNNVQNIKPYWLRPNPYPGKDNLHKVQIIITKR